MELAFLNGMITQLLIIFTAYTSNMAHYQGDGEKFVQIFQSGNAAGIETYFNPSIQLTTPGKQGVYSKSQAKMILSDFFSSNKPVSASIQSQGESDNGAQFVIMKLKTDNMIFRVSFFYRNSNNKIRIHELKIEK